MLPLIFAYFLLKHTRAGTFLGLENCRMAAYIAQNGRCYVTGVLLIPWKRQLHHRDPVEFGGKDTPENTILLDIRVHKLVHSFHPAEIDALLNELALTEEQFRLLNQLRWEAHLFPLPKKALPVRKAA
jgi:hypothetical protein